MYHLTRNLMIYTLENHSSRNYLISWEKKLSRISNIFWSMHLSHFIRIYILKREEAIYKSDVTKYLTIDHDHKVPCHMVHTPVMSSSCWDPNTYNLYSLLWFQLNKNMHTLFHENIYTSVCEGTHSRWIIHINALNLQIWRFTKDWTYLFSWAI